MLWWLLVAGCGFGEERTASREEALLTGMGDHWADATEARDALIDGDLKRARKAASRIEGDLPEDPIPEPLRPMRKGVVDAAARAAKAGDLSSGAVAIGEMAWNCGECHRTGEIQIAIDEAVPASTGTGVASEMARHQQAVQELWRGLLAHDDAALITATGLLATAPLVPSGASVESPLPPLAAELERGVHELADQIARSEGVERGTHFGELLSTCATCHTLFR